MGPNLKLKSKFRTREFIIFEFYTLFKTRVYASPNILTKCVKHNLAVSTNERDRFSLLICKHANSNPKICTFIFHILKLSFFRRGHEEAEIRLQRPNNIEGIEPHNLEVPTSKASIRSTSEDSLEQQCKDYNENGLEEVEGENEVQEDLSKDSDEEDEGDEGLGDIASEASNSPQPPLSLSNNNSCVVVNNTSQQQQKNKNNNYSLPTSPCDERVPSRIPFQAKKHQSQTNL